MSNVGCQNKNGASDMHSFLLIGSDRKTVEEKVQLLCEERAISPFDRQVINKEKSIGIEDIRNLQKSILLAPLQSTYKAAILYKADTMTMDAQNAFLKTLEEPPIHTILILLANTTESFLPTVLSRCFIQSIQSKTNTREQHDSLTLSSDFRSKTIGERLQYAEKLAKSKDSAASWAQAAQIDVRKQLLETKNPFFVHVLNKLFETQKLLQTTNANTRVILEHFFLSL